MPVLCDVQELNVLFEESFSLYPLTGVCNGECITKEVFLREYEAWIEDLKKGMVPEESRLRRIVTAAMTVNPDALWKQEVGQGKYLIKMSQPVVLIQPHFFTYSLVDEQFRSMTLSKESIFWGLHFSYPQIYQNGETMEILESADLPNGILFQKLRKWARDYTRATPFVVEGKKTNVPIRLGKNCFSWIHTHPQLKAQNIEVHA